MCVCARVCVCTCVCVCVCTCVCWYQSLLLSGYLNSQPGVRGLKTNRKREKTQATVRGPGHKPHKASSLGQGLLGKYLYELVGWKEFPKSGHKASLGPRECNLEVSGQKIYP